MAEASYGQSAGRRVGRHPGRAGDAANLDLLVQSLNVPALVFNKYSDVLAADQLARALAPDLKPGTNRLRVLFSEQAAHDYGDDWEEYTATAVAHLRAQMGTETGDERLHSLVGELSSQASASGNYGRATKYAPRTTSLFAYGTLKSAHWNCWSRNSTYLGPYSWKPCCSTPHRAAHRHTLLLFWQPSTTRNAELDQVAVRPRVGLLP
ncbi:hypothetical protein [Streptomyces sp. SID685]|uniref:MmyB family transcriptional regulator n=1 Tax=Streptomyces sp. SID685 TaxID=2690322 RepID=UPI0031FF1F7E